MRQMGKTRRLPQLRRAVHRRVGVDLVDRGSPLDQAVVDPTEADARDLEDTPDQLLVRVRGKILALRGETVVVELDRAALHDPLGVEEQLAWNDRALDEQRAVLAVAATITAAAGVSHARVRVAALAGQDEPADGGIELFEVMKKGCRAAAVIVDRADEDRIAPRPPPFGQVIDVEVVDAL